MGLSDKLTYSESVRK